MFCSWQVRLLAKGGAAELGAENYEEKAKHIASELTKVPKGEYENVLKWRDQVIADVQDLTIAALEPALNKRLEDMPQGNVADKRALCRWVNAELRNRGLAILCPRTGHPAILHFSAAANSHVGRFQIELMGEFGRKRTVSSVRLFELRLTVDAQRRERLANFWTDLVSQESKPRLGSR